MPTTITKRASKKWLTKMYVKDGRSQASIAKQLGCTQQHVGQLLRSNGIDTRPRGRPVKKVRTR